MFGNFISTVRNLSFSLTQLLLYQRKQNQQNAVLLHQGDIYLQNLPTFKHLGMKSLPDDVKRILFRYDCNCVPLFENQLGAYQACENLADMWGIKSSPCSPENQSQLDSASLPVTPAVDPSPSLTPTSSPSLFAGIHKNNSTALFNDNQFDTALIQLHNFKHQNQHVFLVSQTRQRFAMHQRNSYLRIL